MKTIKLKLANTNRLESEDSKKEEKSNVDKSLRSPPDGSRTVTTIAYGGQSASGRSQ